jgi:small GTP-binding protein
MLNADMTITKIAVVGLSNAGKTTIIKVLQHEYQLLVNLQPTLGIERSEMDLFGIDLKIWDFGGQELYRTKYINDADMYFRGISHLYYVIDVQNSSLLNPNVQYFSEVANKIREYSPDAKLTLIFNKMDPIDIDSKQYEEWMKYKEKFLHAIDKLMRIFGNVGQIFETSSQDPLSILRAMTYPLFSVDEFRSNIGQLLSVFCRNYFIDFAILFEKSFFDLGYSHLKGITKQEMHKIFRDYYESFETKEAIPEFQIDLMYGDYSVISAKFEIMGDREPLKFFLVAGYKKHTNPMGEDKIKELIDRLKLDLQNLLQSVDLENIIYSIKLIQ